MEEFEKWAYDEGYILDKDDNGEYSYLGVRNLWKCWKAAKKENNNMDIINQSSKNNHTHSITIRLSNGNLLKITEVTENTIELKNVTVVIEGEEYGLNFTTVDYSTIEITPEG